MQGVGSLDKTGSEDWGNEDLGHKSGGDEPVVKRGATQLDVQELKLEQQPAPQKLTQDT